MSGISRETFSNCDTNDRLAILFDMVSDIRIQMVETCPKRFEICDGRMDILEKKIDQVGNPTGASTAIATAGSAGIVGAILAIMKHYGVIQ